MSNEIKLTVWLKEGRTLSGDYHWAMALERVKFSAAQPNFKGFLFSEAGRP